MNVSPSHPIRALFSSLLEGTFKLSLVEADPALSRYMADLLTEFIHMDRVFKLRDLRGRRIEEIADMLLEGDVRMEARSFDREREVHKQIGDFILFWAGVYPEMLKYFQAPTRKDHLIDYVEQGRSSYYIASTFDHGEYQMEARVLRQLSVEFEFCMFALHRVRAEIDRMGSPELNLAWSALND